MVISRNLSHYQLLYSSMSASAEDRTVFDRILKKKKNKKQNLLRHNVLQNANLQKNVKLFASIHFVEYHHPLQVKKSGY